MEYRFEWDPRKAGLNWSKHGVRFEQAATVFRDPRALSLFDEAHSAKEDRWITLGISATGTPLVVHHTFDQTDSETFQIRIISSRKATRREIRQHKGLGHEE